MEQKNLILLGGGGHCKSVIDVAESAGYNIIGILDRPEEVGKQVLNYNVIGEDDDISMYADKAEFIVTVGFIKNPTLRIRLFNLVKASGGKLATLIAPTAYVSKHATIGEGTVVMHNAFVNADAKVGNNVILNTFSNIEHDAVIGNHCHISTGTMINGGAIIADNTFVGSQSVVNQCVKILQGGVIGSLSAINKNITEKGVYVGNPITKIE